MKEKAKKTQQQQQQQRQKRTRGDRSSSERVRVKWFCCAFKLGFFQLICKASLMFKWILSIILKQRELYGSKHVVV